MPADATPHTILDHLAGHPRADDLARLVHAVTFAVAVAHKPSLSEGLAEAAARFDLSHADADTKFGNVLQALEEGGTKHTALLATVLARGVALSAPEGPDAERQVAEALLWMATHTGIDAFAALDATLGSRADGLFRALSALVREAHAGSAPALGRAGALVGAAALGGSTSPAARAEATALASETDDPLLRSLLRHSAHAPDDGGAHVTGELSSAPRNVFTLLLLAVSGVLLVLWIGRLVGTLLLRYRRQAELSISASGVNVGVKTELFGRTIREQRIHYPVEALSYAAREVKYPRLSLYVGLFALALGSYFGISLFVDGARAGSPELLGLGALVVALGVALDFALTALPSIARGTCRIVIVPRKGAALAVGPLEPAVADGALRRLIRS